MSTCKLTTEGSEAEGGFSEEGAPRGTPPPASSLPLGESPSEEFHHSALGGKLATHAAFTPRRGPVLSGVMRATNPPLVE